MAENFDFIAIGDIVTDAFIRLREAEVHCDIKHETCQICMRFGDKIPFDSVTIVPAVGNSPNAATSAARLGLKSALVTNLGKDRNGEDALARLRENGVSTEFVKVHAGKPTNYHYVLWYQDDRTILIKHEEYEYVLPAINSPKWVYLSSLGENSLPFHHTLANYFQTHPETKLAFQPGTFQIKLGHENLKDLYSHTEVFFCNVEEAMRILQTNANDTNRTRVEKVKVLLKGIHDLGPKIVVITDGKDGAYTYDGTEAWFMPPYPDPKPPLERTGAGDSFASTFISALARGKSVPEALAWGPINSMSVVQHIGAQEGLLTREKLEEFLRTAPEEYKAKKL